jgi:predicted DNA-binding protein
MAVIKKRKAGKKIFQSFRMKPELVKKIEKIAKELGESKTYVLESLLEYGIEAYEKEKGKVLDNKKGK